MLPCNKSYLWRQWRWQLGCLLLLFSRRQQRHWWLGGSNSCGCCDGGGGLVSTRTLLPSSSLPRPHAYRPPSTPTRAQPQPRTSIPAPATEGLVGQVELKAQAVFHSLLHAKQTTLPPHPPKSTHLVAALVKRVERILLVWSVRVWWWVTG